MYFKIKSLAEAQGKTIADVSRDSGVSEATLSMLRKRGGKLTVVNAAKVAKVLGVPIDALLETADNPPQNMEAR